ERLDESGELPPGRRRHAEYFTRLVEELEPGLRGAEAEGSFARLDQEHANLRAALKWSLAPQGGAPEETDPAEFGLRICGALWRFWCARGHLREAQRWTRAVLALGRSARHDAHSARARYAAGCVAEDLGEYAEAR